MLSLKCIAPFSLVDDDFWDQVLDKFLFFFSSPGSVELTEDLSFILDLVLLSLEPWERGVYQRDVLVNLSIDNLFQIYEGQLVTTLVEMTPLL
jgi:hypothetical protein